MHKFIELAKSKGFGGVQIRTVSKDSLSLTIFKGKTDKCEYSKINSTYIKGIYKGKAGSISTEVFEESDYEKILGLLKDAALSLTVVEPAPIIKGGKYATVEDDINDFSSYTLADKIAACTKLESLLYANKKISQVDATFYNEVSTVEHIFNSLGLDVSKTGSYCYLGAEIVFGKEPDVQSYYGYKPTHKFAELDVEKIASELLKNGLKKLGGSSIASDNYKIVFSNEIFPSLFDCFVDVFCGDSLIRKLTPLEGKLETQIASPTLTITDEPLFKKAFLKQSFDNEGVACKKKAIIKDGVFKTFLHNLKTAKITGSKPLGNEFGGVEPTNLVITKGTLNKAQILEQIGEGVYITELMGLHAGANQQSGDFSVKAFGYKITGGKLGKPVKMIVLAGNFYKMLQNILYIGNDYNKDAESFFSPTIAVDTLTIAGN